jgi:hypothetical protein
MIESRYKSFGLAGPSLRIQPRGGGQQASGTPGGAELPLGGREMTPEVCSPGTGGENGPQVGTGLEREPRHIEAGLDTVDKTFCRRCYVRAPHHASWVGYQGFVLWNLRSNRLGWGG